MASSNSDGEAASQVRSELMPGRLGSSEEPTNARRSSITSSQPVTKNDCSSASTTDSVSLAPTAVFPPVSLWSDGRRRSPPVSH